jgi:uncharacterized membrane protein YhaH (DUF805 family)
MNWYLEVFKKYAVFSGRSRRAEFWFFALFNAIVGGVLSVLDQKLGLTGAKTSPETPGAQSAGVLSGLYSLVIFIPTISVGIRRLHDIGKSGWWILINLIPCVGWIWYLVLAAQDGQPGSNEFGSSPKEGNP